MVKMIPRVAEAGTDYCVDKPNRIRSSGHRMPNPRLVSATQALCDALRAHSDSSEAVTELAERLEHDVAHGQSLTTGPTDVWVSELREACDQLNIPSEASVWKTWLTEMALATREPDHVAEHAPHERTVWVADGLPTPV